MAPSPRHELAVAACLLLASLACVCHAQEEGGAPAGAAPPPAARVFLRLRHFDSYTAELFGLALAALYVTNILIGRWRNSALAVAYTKELLRDGGAVDRNFAVADGAIVSSGADLFTTYATGRRNCRGMLLTFRLARRQDLAAVVLGAARRDILDIEVAVSQGAWAPLALFIGSPAAAKVLPRDSADLAQLARRLEPGRDRAPSWPADSSLVAYADSAGALADALTPAVLELAFAPAAWAELKPWFRYVHATTDYPAGDAKSVLRVSTYLPPPQDAAPVHRLVSLAAALADVLAARVPSPEQLKKALEARRKVEAAKDEGGGERERRVEERRAAKDAEERARLQKLPPDQREKERARKEKILRQRRLKSMAKK
jgi:hypothetical protein